jgi:hypothetical protein
MDLQFARPRDAVAAADDLQYMFATTSGSSSSSSSSSRPCKVLLKPRTFSGFPAETANVPASNGTSNGSAAVDSQVCQRVIAYCSAVDRASMIQHAQRQHQLLCYSLWCIVTVCALDV